MKAVLAWLLCDTCELKDREKRKANTPGVPFVLGDALDDHQLCDIEALVENPLQHTPIGRNADQDLLALVRLWEE
jgi:hypothetical protein